MITQRIEVKKMKNKIKQLEAANETLGSIIKAYGETYVHQSELIETFAEVIADCPVHAVGGDINPMGYFCQYCDNEFIDGNPQEDLENFIHKKDCPVLLAEEVLERFEVGELKGEKND